MVSLLASEYAVCHCLWVRKISNQSISKEKQYVSDLSKLDTLLHKTYSKAILVFRFQGSTCVEP